MHDVVLVEFLEGFEELLEVEEGFGFGEEFAFFEEGFDGAPIAVLVDEVEVVGSFEGFDELDDVVVFEGGEDVDFVDGEFF